MSFLKIIASIFVSWLLVHFLAVFGVFLAVAYPIWWLVGNRKLPCLWCRIKGRENDRFRYSLADAGLILLFTLFSIGLVFGESKVLFKLGFPPTPRTVSFVIPPKGQYRLGEIFPLKIQIYGIKVPVNAVQADLGFNPEKIEAVDVSTEGSFANIFIQKEINNEAGYVRLTGGLPNPGFFSDHGLFGTVYFKGKSPGVTKIEFLPSSMVLANDGRGTNVLKELSSVSYLILPERISDEERKLQENLVLKSHVLGEETDKTQMRFYEQGEVLGAKVGQEIEKKKERKIGVFLLGILEKVDRFILTLWGKLWAVFR